MQNILILKLKPNKNQHFTSTNEQFVKKKKKRIIKENTMKIEENRKISPKNTFHLPIIQENYADAEILGFRNENAERLRSPFSEKCENCEY